MTAVMCSIPCSQSNHLVRSDDEKYIGKRRCGHVSISLSIRSLWLHCIFCEFESEEMDLFLNHLKNEHLSLLAAENYWLQLEKDGVVAVKQEILDIAETNVLNATDLIVENETDPLMMNGHEPKRQEKKTECLLCHMMVSDMCKHMKKRHQENDAPQTCKICEEIQPSERHLKIHLRRVHRRYECEYCVDVYAALRTLHNHIRRVHIDKPPPPIHPRAKLPSDRTCEYCGRQFGSKQTLNNHKRFVHLQLRPYACSECGKAFKQKQKLNSHQNSVHLKRREHICNVCSKGFYDRKTLVQHMRLHSDVMKYVCKVCGKSFRQAPALHSHMKTHKS